MHFLSTPHETKTHQYCCAACGSKDLSPYVKASKYGLKTPENHCTTLFYICNQCKSINEFSESDGFYELERDISFANFYLDVGAGIEEMIDPIARLSDWLDNEDSSGRSLSFLELGCGFGFVVDYTANILGWQSHGIEPGGYGRIGSEALNIPIDHQLLGLGSAADGKKHNCIYASEVIEHLSDPENFLRICRGHLKDNGVLVMTTPAAEYITQENRSEEVYACLFPGEHKIIFSADGLRQILSRAGFYSIQVEKRRDKNWLIFASPTGRVPSILESSELKKHAGKQYRKYLYWAAQKGEGKLSPQQKRVNQALCFRLVKYLVNKGNQEEALSVLRQCYGDLASLADPELGKDNDHTSVPVGNDSLICCLLSFCMIGLTRERIEVELYGRPYPRTGAAFFKTLGFFISVIAHNIDLTNPYMVQHQLVVFLESLIGYAIYARNSATPFYHLELISLIGPATSSLILAKKKLNMQPSLSDYPYLSEGWFKDSYLISLMDIRKMCTANENKGKKILNSTMIRTFSKIKNKIKSMIN